MNLTSAASRKLSCGSQRIRHEVVGARRQRQRYPKNRTILLRRSELTLCAKNGREQMQQRLGQTPAYSITSAACASM
jgi:hypothetical protein